VTDRPGDAPDQGAQAPSPDIDAEAADDWVGSFLLAQPGKTYDRAAVEEGAVDAARDAAVETARALTDDVVSAAAAEAAP
jgi:hypothetical protein